MNPNDLLPVDFQNPPTPADAFPPSRRDFLKRLGGGVVVFVTIGGLASAQEAFRRGNERRGRPGMPADFNAYLHIAGDGRVTCFTGKIEMGQGPITSLPQMLADELDVALDTVDIVMGDTDLCPWDAGTWGSMTTRFFGPALREAAAEARAVLLSLASEALQIPVARLATRDGAVYDTQDATRRVTYGALTKGKRIERRVTAKPTLKDVAQFKVMGRPERRRDSRAKVTGEAKYSADIRLPGMLFAKVLRPPAHGATLKSIDTGPARAIPGAQVVQDGDLIAVLHELPDVAAAAIDKVKTDFDVPPSQVNDKTIFEHLMSVAPPPEVIAQGGDLAAGRRLATRTFDRTYLNSYVAHSAMETHAALAHFDGGRMTVWASTQNPFGVRDEVARTLGLETDQVRVITPFVGGGFGGKSYNLQAVHAARLAKATGRPVQVMWDRAEEFYYDTFRPAAIVTIASGIDAYGRMTFWDYDVAYAGDRGAQQFYTVPNHRTSSRGSGWRGPRGSHPFGTGAWGAPGNNTNSFARESQIDMMASAAGMDPVEFRLSQLSDPRMIRVLKAAATQFGWKPAAAPSRRGLGVACGIDAGAYVATIAEVAVDPDRGTVQAKRVVCAQEMGIVINPEGATIQVESCVTMGLGYALTEEIHFTGGRILDTNYDTYTIPHFSWVPKFETVLVTADDIPPQGGGEPAIVVMGAVIANAVFDATGARLLQLPMTPERIKAALKAV